MATHLDLKPKPALAPVPAVGAGALDIGALFRQYARYVAAIGFSLLGNDEEADDLIQDVFLVAFRGIENLREPQAIKGWLATIAVRIARKRLRRRRLLYLVTRSKNSYEDVAGASSDPEQGAFLVQIYAVLDELPVDLRIAWSLRHLEGERLDAVARLCGCSLATAKRRIAAAHDQLRKAGSPWTT